MLKVESNNKIILTRGDSGTLNLSITEGEETYDYSDDTVVFGVKRSVNDKDCVLMKTVENGKIVFTPEDTKNMEFGDYLYDVEVRHTDTSGEEPVTSVYTVIAAAKFVVGYEVV